MTYFHVFFLSCYRPMARLRVLPIQTNGPSPCLLAQLLWTNELSPRLFPQLLWTKLYNLSLLSPLEQITFSFPQVDMDIYILSLCLFPKLIWTYILSLCFFPKLLRTKARPSSLFPNLLCQWTNAYLRVFSLSCYGPMLTSVSFPEVAMNHDLPPCLSAMSKQRSVTGPFH